MQRWKQIAVIVGSMIASVVVAIVIFNLSLGNKSIDSPLERLYPVKSPDFQWVMGAVLTPEIVGGNRTQALVNGDEIFPAMLEAIRSAETTITLETYIYWSGDVGSKFTNALIERAEKGVKIKVLLDWFGSSLDDELLDDMRDSGIDIRRYNPPRWDTLQKINQRSHRRLLVVDGRTGFIGGVGLSDKWSGDAQDPQHWRDTHFKVVGPVVTQLQSTFIDNWLQTTGEVLHGIDYLPRLKNEGDQLAHVFSSSPGGGSKSMQLMYLMSITSATTSIDLSAAYFIPDEVALATMVAALKRGVRIRIIMPGPYMVPKIVTHASRDKWGVLLGAGAELYLYQPTMFHCKVMVVDALWTSVGSTNFDSRSFSINDEANLNVYDAPFANAQVAIFENDLRHSKKVSLEEWQNRSWWERTLDAGAAAVASQL